MAYEKRQEFCGYKHEYFRDFRQSDGFDKVIYLAK